MLLCFRVRAFLFSEIRLQPTALSKYITGMSWCYGHISNFVIDDRNFEKSCRYSLEVLTFYRLALQNSVLCRFYFLQVSVVLTGYGRYCTALQIREYQWIQKNFYCTFARYKFFYKTFCMTSFIPCKTFCFTKYFPCKTFCSGKFRRMKI